MKTTAKKLLDKLRLLRTQSYRTHEEPLLSSADLIYLDTNIVLAIEEDGALPTVSLQELCEVGGNVEINNWVVDDDTVLDKIVCLIKS